MRTLEQGVVRGKSGFAANLPSPPGRNRVDTGLEDLDEVLEEQEGGLAGADGEVLLHLLALLAAEGRIGQHHVEAVLLLNVGEVLGERVGVDDVRRLDAVQDHVHDRDDVGERLLLLAVEGACPEGLEVLGGEVALRPSGSRTPRTGSPPSRTAPS